MTITTPRFLLAAGIMFACSVLGCTENFPLPAHGEEPRSNTALPLGEPPQLDAQGPSREFEVIRQEADGSNVVEFPQVVYVREMRTTVRLENGQQLESTFNIWVPHSYTRTVTIPADKDIEADLNENYPQLLPPPEPETEVLYEIVQRNADGTTFVQLDTYSCHEEIRMRTFTRNGETVEQCVGIYQPARHEVAMILVPAGQDILTTVADFRQGTFQVTDPGAREIPAAPVPEAPVPVAPEADDVTAVPPAPVVDRGA